MSEELKRLIAEETAVSETRGEARGEVRGEARGEVKGRISTLCNLAKEGLLSVAIAAKKAGMSEDAFRKMAML